MKNNNYPSWLVSLEIAKELKTIGFDTPCSFYYDEKLLKISPWHDEEFIVTNWNDKLFRYCVSIPTWEQVFEWFREKGFVSFIKIDNQSIFDEGCYYCYVISNERGKTIDCKSDFDDYNEAREALVKALTQTYNMLN